MTFRRQCRNWCALNFSRFPIGKNSSKHWGFHYWGINTETTVLRFQVFPRWILTKAFPEVKSKHNHQNRQYSIQFSPIWNRRVVIPTVWKPDGNAIDIHIWDMWKPKVWFVCDSSLPKLYRTFDVNFWLLFFSNNAPQNFNVNGIYNVTRTVLTMCKLALYKVVYQLSNIFRYSYDFYHFKRYWLFKIFYAFLCE